ncbi:type VI secretion system tip protein VgrG, partial [Devosia sp.]|uniref:type VI secretion system tip protein VgrG n=1 Tax=Devosia sp. TaxID=1871048 RepID=UPI001AC716BD
MTPRAGQVPKQTGCEPSAKPRRPLPPRKPVVQGPQTALVVGKEASVSTDEQGRIKVRFYWDRENKENDNASCLVRVAQSLAGPGWGAVFIPREGMEVVVHFIDGDPDRPASTDTVPDVSPWAAPRRTTARRRARSASRTRACAASSAPYAVSTSRLVRRSWTASARTARSGAIARSA